jgi:hypothetical protein
MSKKTQTQPELCKGTFTPSQWEKLVAASLEASALPLSDQEELKHQGVLGADGSIKAEWVRALRLVTAAPVEIAFLSGAMDYFGLARYHVDPQENSDWLASAVMDEDGTRHVSFPHTWLDILAFLHGILDIQGPSAPVPVDIELGFDEFTPLMAMVDALKTQQAQSLLDRREFVVRPVSLVNLLTMLQLGTTSQDRRWWIPVIQELVPAPLLDDQAVIGAGLEKLAARGLLERQDMGYLLAGDGDLLVRSLLAQLSFASVILMGRDPRETLFIDHVAAVRTATFFWVFLFSDFNTQQPRVALKSTYAPQFFAYLNELWNIYQQSIASTPQATPPPAAKPEGNCCTQCGGQVPTGAKFCNHCGASLVLVIAAAPPPGPPSPLSYQQPQVPICHKCGFTISLNAGFCSSCGAPRV